MHVRFFVHLQKYIFEFYGNFQSVIKNLTMSAQKDFIVHLFLVQEKDNISRFSNMQ